MKKCANAKEPSQINIEDFFDILDKIIRILVKIEKEIQEWKKDARGGF